MRLRFVLLPAVLVVSCAVSVEGSLGQTPPPESTPLPLVLIETDGATIRDEPKIPARMRIIDNGSGQENRPGDPATDYDGHIGIEIRGASSASYPQRPYGLETRDEAGENLNVPILGMPPENDWVLLSNYNDKSLVRNLLSLDLFRRMGHYAPRMRPVEVVLNGDYRGIYLFGEKIKQDDGRVAVASLNQADTTGDQLTGGYIIQVNYYTAADSWTSSFTPIGHPNERVHFVYHDPDHREIQPAQRAYIQRYVHDLESALYADSFAAPTTGYRAYLDVDSFLDHFILAEVSRNVDGYKKSRFFHKDRDSRGGLLRAGPVWDFDWAWKNIRECFFANTDGSGWGYTVNDCNPDLTAPGWYVRLVQDGYFTERLIDRYRTLRRGILAREAIEASIDSLVVLVAPATSRHFALWPIDEDYRAPEVGPPARSHAEEITRLKTWIRIRLQWLDAHIDDLRDEVVIPSGREVPPDAMGLDVYPNPATSHLKIESDAPLVNLALFDVLGRKVRDVALADAYAAELDLTGVASGIYVLRGRTRSGEVPGRVVHVVGGR